MEQEIAEFRAHVAGLRRKWRGTPYPEAVRSRAVRLAARLSATGLGPYAVGRQLGIRPETLASWSESTTVATFVPVVVSRDERRATAFERTTTQERTVVVTSPSGWRIEGLGIAELERLARVLS